MSGGSRKRGNGSVVRGNGFGAAEMGNAAECGKKLRRLLAKGGGERESSEEGAGHG